MVVVVAGLKWMPFGGLYIAGGLTPKNIDRIKPDKDGHSLFLDAYYDKGRVSPFLKKIPLYAVLVEDLGERGAHWVAIKVGHPHTLHACSAWPHVKKHYHTNLARSAVHEHLVGKVFKRDPALSFDSPLLPAACAFSCCWRRWAAARTRSWTASVHSSRPRTAPSRWAGRCP